MTGEALPPFPAARALQRHRPLMTDIIGGQGSSNANAAIKLD